MSNRNALPIFSTSIVDGRNTPKVELSCRLNFSSPRSKKSASPVSSRVFSEFKTPTSINRSKIKNSSTPLTSLRSKSVDRGIYASMSISPKVTKEKRSIQRFLSDNSLNDSANHDGSFNQATASPSGETSNFVVGVRLRPFTTREIDRGPPVNVVSMEEGEVTINYGTGSSHTFNYDHCFWSYNELHPYYASQAAVFGKMVSPLLDQLLLGYNACLLAYGQTGSGKSYSMMGINNGSLEHPDSGAGIIPRFCFALLEKIKEDHLDACVEISYYELYNEKIHDLLASCESKSKMPILRVREHPRKGPYVDGLSEHGVNCYKDVQGWLTVGKSRRATAATSANETSSRSHSIFSILLTQTREGVTLRSRAQLVDLAGSERVAQTCHTEKQRKEGVSINKSLLSLGKVISCLAERRRGGSSIFVPYRESVLTWLLQESLGGNSKSAMLATISPGTQHLDETLATLRYACQARSIVNRVRRNEDANERIIRDLRHELKKITSIREELEQLKKNALQNSQSDGESDKQAEINRLKEQLRQAEQELDKNELSWEERLNAAEEKRKAELQELRRHGLSIELNLDPCLPYLVNLAADPSLTGTLHYPLPPGITVLGATSDCDIILSGPLVLNKHCEIENNHGKLRLRPIHGADTFINGTILNKTTELSPNDRVVVGGARFFRVQWGTNSSLIDFDYARNELALAEEARLRAELNTALKEAALRETAHAEQLAQLISTLEAERREPNSYPCDSPVVSPYKSSFLQDLNSLLRPSNKDDAIGLHDLDLLVREATHRCVDLNVSLEFQQEQLVVSNALQPAVRVIDTNRRVSTIWRPTKFIAFLEEIRDADTKEKVLGCLGNQDTSWVEENKISEGHRRSGRISLRTQELTSDDCKGEPPFRGLLKEDRSLPEEVINHLTEMQNLRDAVIVACSENPDLKSRLDEALPFFCEFIATFQRSSESASKSVRFVVKT